MIIKNILTKIEIHPIFLILGLISIITGLFKEFLILFILIISHEIGHLLVAYYYNWPITNIKLYPFGGYINFNVLLNHSLKEELLIVLAGPAMQIILYSFIYLNNYFILPHTFNLISQYHYSLLIFNLLPIFPLDGSKIINILYNLFLPFKKAHLFMIYTSFISLIIILFLLPLININFSLYLLIIILIYKLLKEQKNHNYLFNRFILERYLYDFNYNKTKIIVGNKLKKMMLNKKHLFYLKHKYITEKSYLNKIFK